MQNYLLTYDTPPKKDKGYKGNELHLEGLNCDFVGLCIIQMLSHICGGQFVLWELWTFCCTKTFKKVVKLRFRYIGSKVCQVSFCAQKIVASIWRKIHSYTSSVFQSNWNHYFDLKFKLSDISDVRLSVFPFQNCLKIDDRYTLKEKHKNSKKTNCKYGIKRKCQKFSFDIKQWTFW